MSEIINVETYIKKGNKLYKQLSGGANILTYDSLDEVPEDLAEGSFVAVPSAESGGGSGLTVVELTTVLTAEGVQLTDDENAALNAAVETGLPFALKCNNGSMGLIGVPTIMYVPAMNMVAAINLFTTTGSVTYSAMLQNMDGAWGAMFETS